MGVGVGRGRVEVGWGRERSVGSGGCMVRYGVCIGGQRRMGRELEEKRSGRKYMWFIRKGKRGVWKFRRYIGGLRRDGWEGRPRGEQLRGGVCARKKEWEGR